MKKNFRFYLTLWGILLALFNIIAFISPVWAGQEKYTASSWIGYACITAAFAGQLACAYIAFKAENLNKLFYNIPLITVSFTGLIVSFVAGGLCMLISSLPYWVGVIVCSVVLAFTALSIVKAGFAADAVSEIDEKFKSKTLFIKSLAVDAECLMERAKGEQTKAVCKKVYESIRYSDPMSSDALASIESQITIRFHALSEAVKNDSDAVSAIADEVILLVGERNKKCKK